jgi:hypothetical protein
MDTPKRVNLLTAFVVTVLLIGVVSAIMVLIFGIGPYDAIFKVARGTRVETYDVTFTIVLVLVLLIPVRWALSSPYLAWVLFRLFNIGYIFGMVLYFIYMLQIYGLITGGGLIQFVSGPIVSLPLIVLDIVVLMPNLRKPVLRGLGMALGGAVVAIIVVGVLRQLQHLTPAWDIGPLFVFAALAAIGGFMTGTGLFDPRKLFVGEPGLPRAIWMGVVGLLLGGGFVMLLRGLQQIEPIWDVGLGIVVIAFSMSGFFLWGMGAFDPKMSVHGEHAEEEHPEPAEEEPSQILGSYIWKAGVYSVAVLLVIMVVALVPGGPGLRVADDPLASTFGIGYFTMQLPFGGPTVQVSELVVFLGFVLFTILSLAIFGGGIALLFYFLSRNIVEVKNSKPTEEELMPPAPVQAIGKTAGGVAAWIREGLPKLLGQK